MLNSWYCGHFGEDMAAAELAAGIRWHYENGFNRLENSTAFPPEPENRPEDDKLMHDNMEADHRREPEQYSITVYKGGREMKYTRLDVGLRIGGVYTNRWGDGQSSDYVVTDIEDDQLLPSIHLRRLSDGWEMDVFGAGLYQTPQGISLQWDYSTHGHFGKDRPQKEAQGWK